MPLREAAIAAGATYSNGYGHRKVLTVKDGIVTWFRPTTRASGAKTHTCDVFTFAQWANVCRSGIDVAHASVVADRERKTAADLAVLSAAEAWAEYESRFVGPDSPEPWKALLRAAKARRAVRGGA